MYQTRMMGYYPQVIQSIVEFQAIINSEYPEFDTLSDNRERLVSDAYLLTMSQERVEQWEKVFNIRPLESSTIDDRRETIIARIRGQGKLNTSLIKSIVKTFTGAGCNTWIADSTLYIRLYPSRTGKKYQVENIIQEIKMKLPSHLGYDISQAWQYWADVNSKYTSWGGVRALYANWEDVMFDQQNKANQLDYSTLDSFYLG